MNDNLYAPPQADMTLPLAASASDDMFYVVSQRKFTILFLATFGLYNVYWFYQNWSLVKRQSQFNYGPDSDIWPVARVILALFYVHSLFNKVVDHAAARARPLMWDHKTHATVLVVMLIASNVVDRMHEGNLTNVFILVLLFATCYCERSAQAYINQSCGDPEGKSNNALTWVNYVWIALGCVFWVAVMLGMFMPDLDV
jgi:hypothetical protein